jgi:hypothetical protein
VKQKTWFFEISKIGKPLAKLDLGKKERDTYITNIRNRYLREYYENFRQIQQLR